jgi:hypothetical protein
MQAYSDPSREQDPHSLPDLEVFHVGAKASSRFWVTDDAYEELFNGRPGFYWWSCFPGCMPDSDPHGPFPTEAEALADARDGAE